MAVDGQKVNLYTADIDSFNQAVTDQEIDDGGIYFVSGNAASDYGIYVGEELFASIVPPTFDVSTSTCVITQAFQEDVSVPYEITEWSSSSPIDASDINIVGMYVNGLRAVSEFGCQITVSESEGVYFPVLNVIPSHTYTDTTTEFIVDLIKITVR